MKIRKLTFIFTVGSIFLFLVSTVNAFSASDADQNFHSRKYDQALIQYQSLLSQSSSNEQTYNLTFQIAECHFHLGHKDGAVNNYRQAYANTKDPILKRKAGSKLVMIETVDGQYEDSFSTAREIFHQNFFDESSIKAIAYGTYSGWKLDKAGKLSTLEEADLYLMWKKFKSNYSGMNRKHYLNPMKNEKQTP